MSCTVHTPNPKALALAPVKYASNSGVCTVVAVLHIADAHLTVWSALNIRDTSCTIHTPELNALAFDYHEIRFIFRCLNSCGYAVHSWCPTGVFDPQSSSMSRAAHYVRQGLSLHNLATYLSRRRPRPLYSPILRNFLLFLQRPLITDSTSLEVDDCHDIIINVSCYSLRTTWLKSLPFGYLSVSPTSQAALFPHRKKRFCFFCDVR